MSRHDGDFDEFLRHLLREEADAVEPADDGLERIRARLTRPRPAPVAWVMAVFSGTGQRAAGGGGGGGPGGGPRLIQAAGLLTVAAGLLRRDQMLLTAPAHESWHNHAHDVVSAVIYVALVAAPLLLARRFRDDPRWSSLRWPLVAASLATAAVLVVFFTGAFPSSAGLLQRIGVTVPLAAVCAAAARLLAGGPAVPRAGRGDRLS
jgi:hypothetical protein